jgi:hypothetical protein
LIKRLAIGACALLLLLQAAPLTRIPLVQTASAYTDGGGLDCNGWLGGPSDAPVKPNHICADPIDPTTGQHITDNGWYVGHDEPSLQFFSSTPGSANNMQYSLTLPAADPTPKQDGSQTANFENYPAFWFSLSLCDPKSYPFGACAPDSDANSPSVAGSALLELQFYPPGWEPFISQVSCSHTQWCAALNIDSFTNNNLCVEPVNFAFIQKNGIPPGPPAPGAQTTSTYTPNANTLRMNPGDNLVVTIKDNGIALETDVNDLTSSTIGYMIANSANGFKNTSQVTCATAGFNFRPEYSTAASTHITPWTALFANVNFATEIGHFELTAPGSAGGDGGDADDMNCFAGPNNVASATSVAGCLAGELDFDGTSYASDWADGTPARPSSYSLGAPLSFSGGSFSAAYPSFLFATDGPASESTASGSGTTCNTSTGAGCVLPPQNGGGQPVFYPFYSVNGACRFLFGNDVSGQTTNDYGKVAQYGSQNPSFRGTFMSPSQSTPTCAGFTTTVTSTVTSPTTATVTTTLPASTTTITQTSTVTSPTTTTVTTTAAATTITVTTTETVASLTTTTVTSTATTTLPAPTTTVTSTTTLPPTTTTLTATTTSTVTSTVTSTITSQSSSTSTTTATTTTTSSTSSITLNGVQSTLGTVSSSPYQITLPSFNAGTGTNRLLVVGVEANNNLVVSITFGGVPLTQKVHSFFNNDADFWYLTNPVGTANIVVTMSGATSVVVGAYAFSGVDQANSIPTVVSNHNTVASSPTISIATAFPNSWVLDSPSIWGGVTLGSPTCAQSWNINVPSAITGASSSRVASSPGTTTCGWTASSSDSWDDVAIEIKAVP